MLYQPSVIQDVLNRHGFQFKKSLGQNFLIDGNIIQNVLKRGEIGPEDVVLEIGPGIGTLTEALAARAKQVVAVEKDDTLIPILAETVNLPNVEVIHGDILEVNLEHLVAELGQEGPVKVVANLPYYITTPIIAHLLESRLPLASITVMVQKEVGERMAAAPGGKDYGALSLLCQYYAQVSLIQKVPASVFMPRPKVDSVVVHLKLMPPRDFPEEALMFTLIRHAFQKRRKTLPNALSALGEKEVIQTVLQEAKVPANLRPEDVSLAQWMTIATSWKGVTDDGS